MSGEGGGLSSSARACGAARSARGRPARGRGQCRAAGPGRVRRERRASRDGGPTSGGAKKEEQERRTHRLVVRDAACARARALSRRERCVQVEWRGVCSKACKSPSVVVCLVVRARAAAEVAAPPPAGARTDSPPRFALEAASLVAARSAQSLEPHGSGCSSLPGRSPRPHSLVGAQAKESTMAGAGRAAEQQQRPCPRLSSLLAVMLLLARLSSSARAAPLQYSCPPLKYGACCVLGVATRWLGFFAGRRTRRSPPPPPPPSLG